MRISEPIGLAKAILWEEAKGKLRAMLAAEGAEHGGEGERYESLQEAIGDFIMKVEGDALHE